MVIYTITNTINGKQYVGLTTVKPERRLYEHQNNAKNGRPEAIYCAMRKYGVEKFTFEIIDNAESIEELKELEVKWIDKLGTYKIGYNMTIGGDGLNDPSGEVIKKIAHKLRGRKMSPETRKKLEPYWESRRGVAKPQHVREALMKSNLGRKLSEETRQKMSEAKLGKKHSKEHCEAISKSNMGKKMSEACLEKRRHSPKCRPILQLTITGRFIAEHHSINGAARTTGILRTAINNALAKKSGLSYSGGFVWRYKSDFTEDQYQRIISEVNLIR